MLSPIRLFSLKTPRFPEFLSSALREPVQAYIGAGKGGFFAPSQFIAQILNDEEPDKPEIVVWEIPEYHLHRKELMANVSIPSYRAHPFRPIKYEVVAGAGTRQIESRSLSVERTQSRFAVFTERPVRELRLTLDVGRARSRAYIDFLGDERDRLLIIDGRGAAHYDFEAKAPRNNFDFLVNFQNVGVRIDVLGVAQPERFQQEK